MNSETDLYLQQESNSSLENLKENYQTCTQNGEAVQISEVLSMTTDSQEGNRTVKNHKATSSISL